MKTLISSIATIALLISLPSCKKNIYESPIDSEIIVNAVEIDGSIHILASTEKLYPSTGFTICNSKSKTGSKISIKFKHIEEPEAGFTVLAPATCEIDLGNLDESEYSMKFKLNGQTTSAILHTNPLKIEMSEAGNVKLN